MKKLSKKIICLVLICYFQNVIHLVQIKGQQQSRLQGKIENVEKLKKIDETGINQTLFEKKEKNFQKLESKKSETKLKLAILDSGLSPFYLKKHLEITIKNFTLDKSESDSFGHGTFTTSLLFNKSDDCPGKLNHAVLQGLVQLFALKVFNDRQFSTEQFIIDALEFCLKNAIKVIVLPLGTETFVSKKIQNLFEQIVSRGAVIVSAAGNEGPGLGTLTSPGDQDYVLSLGSYSDSSTSTSRVSQFSSRGPALSDLVQRNAFKFKPDALALGEQVRGSNFRANKCVSKSGTSLSAILGGSFDCSLRTSGSSLHCSQIPCEFLLRQVGSFESFDQSEEGVDRESGVRTVARPVASCRSGLALASD